MEVAADLVERDQRRRLPVEGVLARSSGGQNGIPSAA
jgi:hypothetical protein